jgi:excinuclease ABC subunit A
VLADDATLDPPRDSIAIYGAREHNLKNLNLAIPRGKFVVITGVSGSGKSTLAFDLLFAEGQRRFLDSMSAYARQFVAQLARPEVDLITGIPPSVSIEQRNSRGGGKSTVATVTEAYHFIRLLFARLGTQFCPDCQERVQSQTRDQVGRRVVAQARAQGGLTILAPVIKHRKGFHSEVAEWAVQHGYSEIRADGQIRPASGPFRLDRFREHDVEIVVGRLESKMRKSQSTQQLIDQALELGHGTLLTLDLQGNVAVHSTERACPNCGQSFRPLDPKDFSYNSAQGWCLECRGFGELFYLPDVDRGARAEAIEESWFEWQEGKREVCPSCGGARLNPVARAVRLDTVRAAVLSRLLPAQGAPTIDSIGNAAVAGALAFFKALRFTGREAAIGRDILPEIVERLKFLCEVGLGYLQLGRSATTLSGGEAQRIRLAAQLGSNLSGVLYVLDEPTIGLHARDNEQLLAALSLLRARGNSLVVVEHDEATMRRADHIVDLGPGAGVHGGAVVASGTLAELMRHPESITGRCLRARKKFPSRGARRPTAGHGKGAPPALVLRHASANNLKNLTAAFPLNRLVLVTGVSGSGKSTLIRECLLPSLERALHEAEGGRSGKSGGTNSNRATARVEGFEHIKAVYEVDQSPIGRTPRSTPATYTGFFDSIRQLFSQTPDARLRGYSPGRFSFNSPQGRCPNCEGAGTVKLEMNFLPPAFVRCETCGGCRFDRETLDIEYRGRNVAQVLEMSVDEALEFFGAIQKIARPLQALHDTGLGYVRLGQISPTLSGGEAQRMKLVTHLLSGLREVPTLFERLPRHNLFILEEPTIGLHMADVQRLVEVLQRLIDAGHSVIVIEHNLDLIAEADWVIDLGPEAGANGGKIVCEGAPEEIARNKRSHTGRFLRSVLG